MIALHGHADPSWAPAVDLFAMAKADLAGLGDNFTNEELDLYGPAHMNAEIALLLCPAPNAAALAHKLEVFRDEEAYLLTYTCCEIIDALIADARRLADAAPPDWNN